MTNFPSSLDSLSNPTTSDSQLTVSHSSQHANANDAIEALQAKVWINNSTDTASLDYKTSRITQKGGIVTSNGSNLVELPPWADGQMLVADSTVSSGLKYIPPTSGGTVTNTSVVSANGFTGTVANSTTAPAITLWTSVTGLLKWNGTAISQASQGTDYYAPSGTDVSVSDGWTGVSSLTPYWVIVWGTTSTNPVQSISVWSAWQVLTSNWAWANPSFQNIISWKTTWPSSLAIATNTTNNTTSNGTSQAISTWLVFVWMNINVQWVDQNWTFNLQWSPDNVNWTTIFWISAFAYFANNYVASAWPYYNAIILKDGYIRTQLISSGTSLTSITASWYINY